MKFLLALSLAMLGGCYEEMAETKHQIYSKNDADAAGDTNTPDYRYAKYKFTHDDYEDAVLAIRLTIVNNTPNKLEIKDLKEGLESRKVEATDTFSKVDSESSETAYAFTGSTTIMDEVDTTKDHGGTYTGVIALKDDGTVADDGCCGDMTFVPKIDNTLTFAGEKQTAGADETFDKAWWAEVTGIEQSAGASAANGASAASSEDCTDYELVFAKEPVDGNIKATKQHRFDMRVELQCDGIKVTDHEEINIKLFHKRKATLYDKDGNKYTGYDSMLNTYYNLNNYTFHGYQNNCPQTIDKLNATKDQCDGKPLKKGARTYNNMKCHNPVAGDRRAQNKFKNSDLKGKLKCRYRADAEIDGDTYSVESREFTVTITK